MCGVEVGFPSAHLACQFDDRVDRLKRVVLGNNALLDEQMQNALAKQQGYSALWISGRHRYPTL